MATIKCFEDIESWKKAREVCKLLGQLIDEGRFKKSYRLVHQIEALPVLLWTILPKDLKEEQGLSLYNSLVMPKVLAVNCVPNFTGYWTEST